jgi:hypothetical protein
MANPTFEVSEATTTSITVHVDSKGSFNYFSYGLRSEDGSDIIYAGSAYSTSRSFTFSGLNENTMYRVYLSWSTTTTGQGNYDFLYRSTGIWSWHSSNGNATSTQTRNAYSAVTNSGMTKEFSYIVWNDMVGMLGDEILNSLGYYWNNKYASLASTRMTSTSRILTAARFNSFRYNVGLYESTGISEVASGDTVYGWYFTTLINCMNLLWSKRRDL